MGRLNGDFLDADGVSRHVEDAIGSTVHDTIDLVYDSVTDAPSLIDPDVIPATILVFFDISVVAHTQSSDPDKEGVDDIEDIIKASVLCIEDLGVGFDEGPVSLPELG
jgi:hypothetical protein